MKLGYVIFYVPDVEATLAFYEKAFGLKISFVDETRYGELETTVFYMVGGQLWADHFCDYLNEPRYTLHFSSGDSSVVQFQFRSATNLDSHPVHFHSTTWRFVDRDHLIQDWYTSGSTKAVPPIRMEFTRSRLSVRADGFPTVFAKQ